METLRQDQHIQNEHADFRLKDYKVMAKAIAFSPSRVH